MRKPSIYRQRSTLMALLYALIFFLVGAALVFLGELQPLTSWLHAVLREMGAIIVAVAAISVLFELVLRRAFFAELTSASQLADEIHRAGILTVSTDFYHGIDWQGLFRSSTQVDVYFSYARTWRNANRDSIAAFAARKEAVLRVFLPDSQDPRLVEHLAERFSMTPDELQGAIDEAARDFVQVFKDQQGKAKLEIWFVKIQPVYTFYLFNEGVVMALYNHQRRKTAVPVFVAGRNGYIYDFVTREVEYFLDPSKNAARRVYPADSLGALPPGLDRAVAVEPPRVEVIDEMRGR